MTSFEVSENEAGARLDRFLADALPDFSRSQIQKNIESGAVSLNGKVELSSKVRVKAGDVVLYEPPPPSPIDLLPENIPLSILYEDESLLVVDKPAGLVVHPALGHWSGTLVHALLFHVPEFQTRNDLRPGIVHRLDQETSGAMIVAKTEAAQSKLVEMFQERKIKKTYLAVTHGVPNPRYGRIETKFGRHPKDRKRFSSRVPEGKEAITEYEVIEAYPGAALLSVRLETGRTHQIRVHFSDLGYPLVGDKMYGARKSRMTRDPRVRGLVENFERTALHAHKLAFLHPITSRKMSFEAPIPEDLANLIAELQSVIGAESFEDENL